MELDGVTIPVAGGEWSGETKKTTGGMLDFEQQTNQAPALASLDDDWHLLEGECTTFAIFLLSFLAPFVGRRAKTGRPMPHIASKFKSTMKESGFSLYFRTTITKKLHITHRIVNY